MGAENFFSTGARKLFAFPLHLEAFRRGLPMPPVTVEIQPTERCNHRCPDCQAATTLPLAEVRERGRRGADLELSLLDSLWELPPQGVVLSGNTGDPLVHPRIGDLLQTLRSRNLPTIVITNGEAVDEGLAEALVATCTGIRVSLDAADAESHRRTHGTRAEQWDAVLRGVEHLVRARNKVPADRRPSVGAGYLTGNDTRAGMIAATRLCRSLGLDYIQFRPFHGSTAEIDETLSECGSLASPPVFAVLSSDQKYSILRRPERSYSRCHGAAFFSVIDARGDVYLCCHHVGRPEARAGSLRESSWANIVQRRVVAQTASAFPVGSCVPHCRLHSHNETLERVLRGETGPTGPLPDGVQRHAAFL